MLEHLLSWITFLPLLGALAVLITPKASRAVALVTTVLVGALTGVLAWKFQSGAGLQFVEKALWIPQFNVHYFLAVDGISFPMVILTALIALIGCVASAGIKEREKEYYFLYLVLETGMLGTFLALDLFLFYIFWEAVLIPMYFLIGIWGGERRSYAAIKFFLYTLAGSLVLLVGLLALYFASTPHTWDWTVLSKTSFALGFQKFIFLTLFLGFAIKVPAFPFHTWLPDAHVEAPTPISVILAGVLLKMGTYGFLRFSYPLAPDAAHAFAPIMLMLAVIGIVYGGFVALAQTDFKKMVAYSSVSHMGFVLLGLAVFTTSGVTGALMQMFNHGLITSGLFLLVGVIYDRTHTREMNAFGGLGAQMPVYAGILLFFSLASLGLPGLAGFVSEFLILYGAYQHHPGPTLIASLGLFLAAAYLLTMIRRVAHGPANPKWNGLPEINRREVLTLAPLAILILVIGICPNLFLPYITPAVHDLLVQMKGNLP